MCEYSSPDPGAELLSSVSASYLLALLAVKPVHLEPGQSHGTSQQRQATEVLQANREAGAHLTHS